jgi:exonuclease SbcC
MRLLRAGLQDARQRQHAQRAVLECLGAERAALGDTAAGAALARQNRNVAAARLDAKRTALSALSALRAEQAQAAAHEQRRAQLAQERAAALAERQRDSEALEQELQREQAARDETAQRHAQRAARRETTLASHRAQRTTLLASMDQVRRAERAARRLPAMRAVHALREARLAELREALAHGERMAAQLALAQSRQAAVEREAGQAALAAQALRRRFALTAEVPCAGMALQAGCKLLEDAHAARTLLPDAGAVVARLNAAHAALAAEIAPLRVQAAGLPHTRTAVRRAEARLARSCARLAQCERQAARRDALAQAGPMLAEVEARLATYGEHCAAERRDDAREEDAQRRRIAELAQRRALAAQPSATVQRIDALLAALPPAFDAGILAKTSSDCEQARARLGMAEQAQLAALRDQDRATALAAQRDREQQACAARERHLQRLERHLEDWSLLAKALGNDGIIALAIDDAGPALSALANQLLLACYGPRFSVSIQTQLATAKGDLREGFDITVHDARSDARKSVAKMSGGERIWINECLTRAMALYLAQAGGKRSATLFSDEADGAFDSQHKRRFMAMKREVLRIGGYAQEFFISHTPELAGMADAVIDLERYAK